MLTAGRLKDGTTPLTQGDGDNYTDKNYQRLLQNAIHWAASDQALNWARANKAHTS
ncbi:MAG: hypothetical protein ACNYPE_12135 [Candidatus Azotimanducaceae bacterium WSBS_2022_MAG_OTU7]